jgi:hypothetical protein
MDKFKPLKGEVPPMGPQLPVYQPKKGEILEPRGRGGDVKKLGEPKEPVPQKTVVTGEITVPQSGSVTPSGGGPTKAVTTTTGQITTSEQGGPGPKGGPARIVPPTGDASKAGIVSRVGVIGLSLGAVALEAFTQYLIAKQVADFEEKVLKQRWTALEPDIQRAMAALDIEKSLKETNYRKTIYANIHMDVHYVMSVLHTRSGASWRWAFADLRFVGVDISAQDIQRDDKSYTSGSAIAPVWHRPFTYSVAIAEPAALVLPDIRNVHDLLAAIRTDLMPVRGGSAGEAVALDYLNTGLQATDVADPSAFQHNTAAERFRVTVDAITGSLRVLEAPSGENPGIQRLTGRLRIVKAMVNALASRWLLMV